MILVVIQLLFDKRLGMITLFWLSFNCHSIVVGREFWDAWVIWVVIQWSFNCCWTRG